MQLFVSLEIATLQLYHNFEEIQFYFIREYFIYKDNKSNPLLLIDFKGMSTSLWLLYV